MTPLNLSDVTKYVEENISTFHRKRLEALSELKLSKVLSRKNPYLFRAKHLNAPDKIVRAILDAHLSSQEETIFGDWLEGLALFINKMVFGGHKSVADGIDLEFNRDDIHYIVTIKSGPYWANSKQLAKMKADFTKAHRISRTSGGKAHVEAVNGCCYGREKTTAKDGYTKLCGQAFWEFISGSASLYTDIVEPLGHLALEKNQEFLDAYEPKITGFIAEFTQVFCDDNFIIQWDKLVEFNSGITLTNPFPKLVKPRAKKAAKTKKVTPSR